MLVTFFKDIVNLPRKKFSLKYTLPFLLFIFTLIIAGQIATQFFNVKELNKVSGRILYTVKAVKSKSFKKGFPTGHYVNNYALFIYLDDMKSYDIEDYRYLESLQNTLKRNDFVTIYYPTLTLRILSAGFVRDISQIERHNSILYSWKDQQKDSLFLIALFLVITGIFYGLRYYLKKTIG